MAFDVAGSSYQAFMGRYADPLAPLFADLAGVTAGQRVVDVGCGTGALSAVLADRVGADRLAAIDPSEPFVAAARERLPEVEVRRGAAEALPYDDGAFDTALAQLVVHFMADPVRGVSEMARVTRAGGRVAACVWDHGSGRGPLSPFWDAAGTVLDVPGESHLVGSTAGDLTRVLTEAGLAEVAETELAVSVRYQGFEEWWTPYTFGVGPAGDFVGGLDDHDRDRVRESCRESLGSGPFTVEAVAWAATGRVAG